MFTRGRSCNFQLSCRGGSLSFVPNGRGWVMSFPAHTVRLAWDSCNYTLSVHAVGELPSSSQPPAHTCCVELALKGVLCTCLGIRADYIGLLVLLLPDSYAMQIRPNKAETAVHGWHCPGDMAVCMLKVLARPWVGVWVCHLLLM